MANPRYKSEKPGERLPILFESATGKVAWPHLKPHFGKRVPFSREPQSRAMVGDDPPRRGRQREFVSSETGRKWALESVS